MASPEDSAPVLTDAATVAAADNDTDMADAVNDQEVLRKRKREDDVEDGDEVANQDEDTLFLANETSMPIDEFVTLDDDDDDDGELDESDPIAQANEDDLDEDIDMNDADVDENNPTQTTYNSTTEPFPKCAVYDERIAEIAADSVKLPQMVRDVLQQHCCDSLPFKALQEASAKLLSIPPVKKFRIALLGDAGAGKSSVLNSLTDVPDLAKSLSGGQSCTCVPTEYSGPFDGQRKDFAAFIFYYDMKGIRATLVELIKDYNQYVFEFDNDWDDEAHTAFKSKMQNALKIFRTLFSDLAQFKETHDVRETLEESYRRNDQQLINIMIESCELKLKHKIGPKGYSEFREADTHAKLRERIDPLTISKANFDEPALWPLVKQVHIHVRGSRILNDITIIDLPGISDTHEARVNLTKNYVKTCNYVWIVAQISRVVDDGMVYRLLSTYGMAFKGSIAVICTHSDDGVEKKLVNHLKECGQDMTGYQQLTKDLKAKKTQITQACSRIKALKALKRPTKAHYIEARAKEDELKLHRDAFASVDRQRFAFLVKARNDTITKQLQEGIEYHLPKGSSLRVFCVSNLHYRAIKGLTTIRGSKLDPDATGIPALRAFALTLPAPKLLRAIEDHLTTCLVVWLKNMALWASKTSVDRRRELMQTVKLPGDNLEANVVRIVMGFKRELNDNITTPMRDLQLDAIKTALKVHAQKNKMHHATIRAFIRKDGQYATRLCPKECWNEQFSKALTDEALRALPALEAGVLGVHEELEDAVNKDLRGVISALKGESYAASLPMARLSELVNAHILSISNMFRDDGEAYEQDLRTVLLDITQHSDMNYFSRAMAPVYATCNDDRGTVKRDTST